MHEISLLCSQIKWRKCRKWRTKTTHWRLLTGIYFAGFVCWLKAIKFIFLLPMFNVHLNFCWFVLIFHTYLALFQTFAFRIAANTWLLDRQKLLRSCIMITERRSTAWLGAARSRREFYALLVLRVATAALWILRGALLLAVVSSHLTCSTECGLLLRTSWRSVAWSVCVCLSLLGTSVRQAETDERCGSLGTGWCRLMDAGGERHSLAG